MRCHHGRQMGDVVIENKLQPHPHGVDLGRWVDALEGRGTGHAALTKIFAKHGLGREALGSWGLLGKQVSHTCWNGSVAAVRESGIVHRYSDDRTHRYLQNEVSVIRELRVRIGTNLRAVKTCSPIRSQSMRGKMGEREKRMRLDGHSLRQSTSAVAEC
jgi:hypothetical protein